MRRGRQMEGERKGLWGWGRWKGWGRKGQDMKHQTRDGTRGGPWTFSPLFRRQSGKPGRQALGRQGQTESCRISRTQERMQMLTKWDFDHQCGSSRRSKSSTKVGRGRVKVGSPMWCIRQFAAASTIIMIITIMTRRWSQRRRNKFRHLGIPVPVPVPVPDAVAATIAAHYSLEGKGRVLMRRVRCVMGDGWWVMGAAMGEYIVWLFMHGPTGPLQYLTEDHAKGQTVWEVPEVSRLLATLAMERCPPDVDCDVNASLLEQPRKRRFSHFDGAEQRVFLFLLVDNTEARQDNLCANYY